MIDWLTSKGFRVHFHRLGRVSLQRGAFYAEYSSLKAAFLAHDGPYTSCKITTGAPK